LASTPIADYRAEDIGITSQGSRFLLTTPNGQCEVSTVLIGKHNIENILTAAALVGTTFGLSAEQIADGLRDAAGRPGRLQAVSTGQEFAVLVDYAHTDDALANVLLALRPLTRAPARSLRLRRRSRSHQAPAHGARRRTSGRCGLCHQR
jgi:UDP-N-acetylmuramoyl-L-alanyl-D-glutamate--2,6-diaminopimelate ligase